MDLLPPEAAPVTFCASPTLVEGEGDALALVDDDDEDAATCLRIGEGPKPRAPTATTAPGMTRSAAASSRQRAARRECRMMTRSDASIGRVRGWRRP